jgi:hypothetical protein
MQLQKGARNGADSPGERLVARVIRSRHFTGFHGDQPLHRDPGRIASAAIPALSWGRLAGFPAGTSRFYWETFNIMEYAIKQCHLRNILNRL